MNSGISASATFLHWLPFADCSALCVTERLCAKSRTCASVSLIPPISFGANNPRPCEVWPASGSRVCAALVAIGWLSTPRVLPQVSGHTSPKMSHCLRAASATHIASFSCLLASIDTPRQQATSSNSSCASAEQRRAARVVRAPVAVRLRGIVPGHLYGACAYLVGGGDHRLSGRSLTPSRPRSKFPAARPTRAAPPRGRAACAQGALPPEGCGGEGGSLLTILVNRLRGADRGADPMKI